VRDGLECLVHALRRGQLPGARPGRNHRLAQCQTTRHRMRGRTPRGAWLRRPVLRQVLRTSSIGSRPGGTRVPHSSRLRKLPHICGTRRSRSTRHTPVDTEEPVRRHISRESRTWLQPRKSESLPIPERKSRGSDCGTTPFALVLILGQQTALMQVLTTQAMSSPGNSFQSLLQDRLTAVDALSIFARLNSLQRLVD
jgi:hypothetical protein